MPDCLQPQKNSLPSFSATCFTGLSVVTLWLPSQKGCFCERTFGLGESGRYRTNVWQYRGVNSRGAGRLEDLALHPTVKPVAMIADAIRDCSRRGGIVLDAFGGSASTLIAAHKTRRRGRLIEIDPIYVDRAIRRWEKIAKDDAVLVETGETFAQRRAKTPARSLDDPAPEDRERCDTNYGAGVGT